MNYDFLFKEGVLLLVPHQTENQRENLCVFEDFEGHREFGKFVKPSDAGGFTAQKSQASDWLKFIW